MRDFHAHVRRHLPRAGVPEERYSKMVDELADELEAVYTSALRAGAIEHDAWQKALAQIPSWPALADALRTSTPPRRQERRWSSGAWRWPLLPDRWVQDVKVAVRSLTKDRGYTATAVLTLAICLGGNAAIIPSVNAILLNPLRVPEPERVLLMANQYPKVEARRGILSATPDYEDRLRFATALDEQAMYNYTGETIETDGVPTRVLGLIATPSLLRLLRVTPAVGRIFSEQEGTPGNEHRVVLSDGLWRELYGGDPAIVGSTLRLTGREFTIVGVLPPGFSFGGTDVRFWIPLALTERQRSPEARYSNGWYSVGRLKPGAAIQQVRDQLKALDAANAERFPQVKPLLTSLGFYTGVEPLQDALVRDVKGPLTLIWAAALAVLAIGVANLGHLALARSRLRLHEFGTRLAIGARRVDIVRQLLAEGSLVASLGTLGGLALGMWIVTAMKASRLSTMRGFAIDTFDTAAIAVTAGLGLLAGTVIALISAVPLATTRVGTMLKEETRTGLRGRTARNARRTLVVAQMACSFVLLVGATLLWTSIRSLLAADMGFTTTSVITGVISLPPRYAGDNARAFVSRSLEAMRRLPGVSAAGASTIVPLSGNYSSAPIVAEGYVPQPGELPVATIRSVVTPGYFEATGTALVRGRYLDERDNLATTQAIVIDERLARRFWGDADPIGRRVSRPETPREPIAAATDSRWLTVVGVVRHARLRGPAADDDLPISYLPYAVSAPRDFGYVIRTSVDPTSIVPHLRSMLVSIDREVPLSDVRTLTERTDLALGTRRLTVRLATLFALSALLLSAVGLYGVLSYLVTRRIHEIGVRVAVGSTPANIVRLVVGEGVALAVAGIAVGAVTLFTVRGVVSPYLYGLAPADPWIMTLVALALALIAIAACVVPARRAARVDAIQVLRAA